MPRTDDHDGAGADWSDFEGWSSGATPVAGVPNDGPTVAQLDEFYGKPRRRVRGSRSAPPPPPSTVPQDVIDYFVDDAPHPVLDDGSPALAAEPFAPTDSAPAPVPTSPARPLPAPAPTPAPAPPATAAAPTPVTPMPPVLPVPQPVTPTATPVTPPLTPQSNPPVRTGKVRLDKAKPSSQRDAKSPAPRLSVDTLRSGALVGTSLVASIAAAVVRSRFGPAWPMWATLAVIAAVTCVSVAALRRSVLFGVPVLLATAAASAFPGMAAIALPATVSALSLAYVIVHRMRRSRR